MMLAWIRFGLAALCLLAGTFTVIVSLVGLFRFDFALNRIHAAALADTLGLLLFMAGLMIAAGFQPLVWKLLLIVVMQWCTAPLSSHMLSQFEYRVDDNLARHVDLTDAEYHTEEVSKS